MKNKLPLKIMAPLFYKEKFKINIIFIDTLQDKCHSCREVLDIYLKINYTKKSFDINRCNT